MTIITRRQALVLVIVMGLLAMSLALSWDVFIDRDQTVSTQEAGQEAREQRDALVSSLTPGAVLYQKFSHYNPHASTPERHGCASARVPALTLRSARPTTPMAHW